MSTTLSIAEKNERLGDILREMGSLLVAYSGGVDSTFLLYRANQELPGWSCGIIASSETFPLRELTDALILAKGLELPVLQTSVNELDRPEFALNGSERCYHCKQGLYQQLQDLNRQYGYAYIADGSHADDALDYRPGMKAKDELGIVSPLMRAGLTKQDIRLLAQAYGLPNWNKPSFSCLSSRIPYGTTITQERISQVDQAESYLLSIGFRQVRVRHHDQIARIEVEQKDIVELIQRGQEISDQLREYGFRYITLDLEGYRSGSMNEVLQHGRS